MNTSLLEKCFISHSYADPAALERLITSLPDGVSLVVFPLIQAKPHEFVSTLLVETILGCEGLVSGAMRLDSQSARPSSCCDRAPVRRMLNRRRPCRTVASRSARLMQQDFDGQSIVHGLAAPTCAGGAFIYVYAELLVRRG